jgi:hypothetical protein
MKPEVMIDEAGQSRNERMDDSVPNRMPASAKHGDRERRLRP